ncbi:YpbS family protein [Rossellomorea aquimaris]|uniref:YpbS family protein n=1 Tax=Rossellomorea aquimaris TaxID=189382 RepID=UPI001CD75F7A|nr:YpbS family protein [Rossellomorea aquimaris]MCA1057053.1 YpbS family protein [Rossellomorea aquimaris]
MSVHKDITKHSAKQNQLVQDFMRLDHERERAIEEAVKLCQEGKPFTTDRINEATERINSLARQGVVPQRKIVTREMVEEYVGKLNQQ